MKPWFHFIPFISIYHFCLKRIYDPSPSFHTMLLAGSASTSTRGAAATKRRHKNRLVPFANDPVRSSPLPLSDLLAAPLPRPDHLQTGLLDFLLQNSFSRFPDKDAFGVSNDLLLASSNSYEFFKIMTDVKKYPPNSPKILEPIRNGYSDYGSGPYRLLVVNCMGDFAHYHALDIAFDINSNEIFHHVRVYDSLAKRHSSQRVPKSSAAGQYLRLLQAFLIRFCFFGKEGTNQLSRLKANPDFILQKATNEESPQQTNGWDCRRTISFRLPSP